jgi:hypothetical protein
LAKNACQYYLPVKPALTKHDGNVTGMLCRKLSADGWNRIFLFHYFMTASAISQQRLFNQHVHGTEFDSAKELVHWMGAIQAQDYQMAKYAIGVRLKKTTDQTIEDAINKGEIIRTHVLRPTWHFTAAEDIRWMLELTAKNLNRALSSNNKRLELDEKIFRKSHILIEKLLRGGKHLTRKEIMAALEKKGIKTDDLRSSHIMFRAETDLVVCNGIKKDKQFTYALFDERIPSTKKKTREEALAELALRYFKSHGPATLQDFTWWSGLSVADAKRGLEAIKSNLVSEKYGEYILWFGADRDFKKKKNNPLVYLPSFDEFLISYKSRRISINPEHTSHAFTNNGIFNPVIVHNAKVIGTWKPKFKKEVTIKEHFFINPTEKQKQLCKKAAKEFRKFTEVGK